MTNRSSHSAGNTTAVSELDRQLEGMATQIDIYRAKAREQYRRGNKEACKRWIAKYDRLTRDAAELRRKIAVDTAKERQSSRKGSSSTA